MGISQQIGASSLIKPGVCTSTTRPASPYEGQMVYETDTDMLGVWNGSSWRYFASATATSGSVLQVVTNQPAFSDQNVTSTSETMLVSSLATITPKSASSKIIIFFTFGAYPTNFLNYYSLFIRRGAVGAGNKITSTGATFGDWTHNYQMNSAGSFGVTAHQQYDIHCFDTAGTTSPITYSLTGVNNSGSSGALVMWSGAINRITLMEVAG
jgi:hypothetical protein